MVVANNEVDKLLGTSLLDSYETTDSCEKSQVNALPKVVGFLRGIGFPPTGKVDRVG
jgi:hypothetical protein